MACYLDHTPYLPTGPTEKNINTIEAKKHSFIITIIITMKPSILHSLLISLSFVSIHFLHSSYGTSSAVKYLPGFPGQLPFELETGYIGVDEGENVQLFYYFVKSSSENPENDPLVLWLTGGPGCSAITGLMFGIGPLKFEEFCGGGLPNLTVNPYSWTEVANFLFLDLPVGTGFSYAKTPESSHSTGLQSCQQAYQFLQKWLVDHPDFALNPFYVGGDSYAGVTVPVIVQLISDGNEAGMEARINLKGYLLGNPVAFRDEENYRIPYAHGMGLISDELYQSLRRNCRGKYMDVDSSNLPCSQDVQTYHQLVDDLYEGQILEPKCKSLYIEESKFIQELHDSEILLPARKCHEETYRPALYWANNPSVQEALHIQEGSVTEWVRCNHSSPLYTEKFWETTPYHAYLSTKGFRSLIYSGDHDLIVPYISTQAWIRSLNYPIVEEWKQWVVEGQIAGYTRMYANNMTFVTIKGAGHVAPEYLPERCAVMVKRWMSYQSI